MENLDTGATQATDTNAATAQRDRLLATAAAVFTANPEFAPAPDAAPEREAASDADQHGGDFVQAPPAGESVGAAEIDGALSADVEADFGAFPPAPQLAGEFTLPLSSLQAGALHLRRDYDFESGVGHSLLHAALHPETLAPLSVMKAGNGWYVVDGWARLEALRIQNGAESDIKVRVTEWTGTEKDALLVRFSQTFMTLGSKKIELARQLRQVSDLWAVPQSVLAARIGWTQSKVTKHLAAAKLDEGHPRFKQLLERSENPPIDFLYQCSTALNDAAEEDAKHPRRSLDKGKVAAILTRLDKLLASDHRFSPAGALVALGLTPKAPDPELPFDKVLPPPEALVLNEAQLIDAVMGHDDEVVGALEMHPDGQPRILLPPNIDAMNALEREAARAAFHALIDKLFA